MKKKLLLGLLSVSLSLSTAQAAHDDAVLRSIEAQLRDTSAAVAPASDNGGFRFQGNNDIALTIGGQVKSEYVRQHRTESFNKDLPDEFASFKDRVDINLGVTYGEERYGSPAVEMGATIRHKHTAGKFDTLSTKDSSFKIGNALQKVDGAGINHPLGWFKHLWLKTSLNALAGRNANTDHTLEFGLFDHSVGRGIAYGPFYGSQKKHLGVFRAANDFAPFGIRLAGELLKDRLGYDVYFARLEEKSANFAQTFNRDMSHVIGRRANPESGVGKSNDVLAARLKYKNDSLSIGSFENEYYLVYNDASNQQVEIANDSKSELGIVGSCLEYKKGDFEFGYEAALNFGHQEVYAIDRNVIKLNAVDGILTGVAVNTTPDAQVRTQVETIAPTYSHITVDGSTGVINADVKSLNDNYKESVNSVTLGKAKIAVDPTGDANLDVDNAADRYRPAYRNNYHGWMAVADMTYNWRALDVKIHAAAGHASGDVNPNDVKEDKNYHGFVGLNENYAGKRVKSVFVLNARRGQRPHIDEDGEVMIDNSFTDISFVGVGADWKLPKRNLDLGANLLMFFKDKAGFMYKYNPVSKTGTVGTEKARKFYGTEANATFNWKLLPGLALAGEIAAFLPGTYYDDTKGTPLPSKVVTAADKADTSGFAQAEPRMSTNTAFHFNVGMQFKF